MAFKYAIALTGGIATGKSTVAKAFSTFGFTVIDADSIGHKILDEQYLSISQMFGTEFIEKNKVNRKKLGKIIFEDKTKREYLESLLHPLIFKEIEKLSEQKDKACTPYLIDIPLFFETKRYPIEKSLLVYTDKETQTNRLILRNGYNQEEAKIRIESQLNIEDKREHATYIIDNTSNLLNLNNECKRVHEEIIRDFI